MSMAIRMCGIRHSPMGILFTCPIIQKINQIDLICYGKHNDVDGGVFKS